MVALAGNPPARATAACRFPARVSVKTTVTCTERLTSQGVSVSGCLTGVSVLTRSAVDWPTLQPATTAVYAAFGKGGEGRTNLAFSALSMAKGVTYRTPMPRQAFGILIRLVVFATTSCVTTVY